MPAWKCLSHRSKMARPVKGYFSLWPQGDCTEKLEDIEDDRVISNYKPDDLDPNVEPEAQEEKKSYNS